MKRSSLPADQDAFATVDLDPLHRALLHPAVDVAREGVERLVVVLVGVEGAEGELAHALLLPRADGASGSVSPVARGAVRRPNGARLAMRESRP